MIIWRRDEAVVMVAEYDAGGSNLCGKTFYT